MKYIFQNKNAKETKKKEKRGERKKPKK